LFEYLFAHEFNQHVTIESQRYGIVPCPLR
jgi:hypothetical protein